MILLVLLAVSSGDRLLFTSNLVTIHAFPSSHYYLLQSNCHYGVVFQLYILYKWNHAIFVCVFIFPFNITSVGSPGGSDGKDSTCNSGDLGSIPGSGRSPGEGNGNSLQYSCLENPMDRGS